MSADDDPESLKAAVARRVAVTAQCDPRTVQAVYAGGELVSMSRERAHAELVRLGLLPAAPSGAEESGHG